MTFNLKDFPKDVLIMHNIEAIHPDDFIGYQMDLQQSAVVLAAGKCRRRLRNPPITGSDHLDTLESQGLPKTVSALRPYAPIL